MATWTKTPPVTTTPMSRSHARCRPVRATVRTRSRTLWQTRPKRSADPIRHRPTHASDDGGVQALRTQKRPRPTASSPRFSGLCSNHKRSASGRPVHHPFAVRAGGSAPPNPWARGGWTPASFPRNSRRLRVPNHAWGPAVPGHSGARRAPSKSHNVHSFEHRYGVPPSGSGGVEWTRENTTA